VLKKVVLVLLCFAVDNIFVTYCVMVLLTYVIICVSLLLCFLVFIFYDITVACGAKFLVYVVFAFFCFYGFVWLVFNL